MRTDPKRADAKHGVGKYPKDYGASKRDAEGVRELQWARGDVY